MKKLRKLFAILTILLLYLHLSTGEPKRGGGSRSSSSSGGSSSKSGSRGSSGGLFSGWFGGSKKSSSSSSSYPKQTYSSSSGQSGSSWSTPKKGGYYSSPYYSRSGFSGGYYGPSGYTQSSSSIFGSGGKKAFALGAGAGFIGGAVAGAGTMSIYHRYRYYQQMMMMNAISHGGSYGYGWNDYSYNLFHEGNCVGGCPMQAFCDYGICRCRDGYEARFGSCYQNFEQVYDGYQREEFNARSLPNYNPFKPCMYNSNCWDTDMNLQCNSTSKQCECRVDMKWNSEVGECQVFMDVDCSDEKPKDVSLDAQTTLQIFGLSPPNSTDTFKTSTEASNSAESFKTSTEASNSAESFNSTLDSIYGKNATDLMFNDTLKDSNLLNIKPNETSADEIKAAFCREIGSLANRYESQFQRGEEEHRSEVNQRNEDESSQLIVTIFTNYVPIGLFLVIFIVIVIRKRKQNAESAATQHPPNEDQGHFLPLSTTTPTIAPNSAPQTNTAPLNDQGQFLPLSPTTAGTTNAPSNIAPSYPPQNAAPTYPPPNAAPTNPPNDNPLPYPPKGDKEQLPYPPVNGASGLDPPNFDPPPYDPSA